VKFCPQNFIENHLIYWFCHHGKIRRQLYEGKDKIRKLEEKTRQQKFLPMEKENCPKNFEKNHKEKRQEKILQENRNNQKPGYLSLGKNAKHNNYLRHNPEQKAFPYYWVDSSGNIHCHCVDNPLAVFIEKLQRKCAKPNHTGGKCFLLIPNIQ
jgi:hypothetical protein